MNSAKSTQRFAQYARLTTECIPLGSGARFWVLYQLWTVCMLQLKNMQTTEGELSIKNVFEVKFTVFVRERRFSSDV